LRALESTIKIWLYLLGVRSEWRAKIRIWTNVGSAARVAVGIMVSLGSFRVGQRHDNDPWINVHVGTVP
jgi:hypothetical protein